MTPLLIAIFAGLGGMLGWGIADFFAKKTIDKIGDVQSLAWAGIFGSIAFIPALVYQQGSLQSTLAIPDKPEQWFGLIFYGVLQAAVYLFAYNGFGKGQIAILAPLFASFAGWVAFFSIFIFGETATIYRIAALIVVFLGLMLLSLDPAGLKKRKISFKSVAGFWQIFVATILAAIWTLGWDKFSSNQEPVQYSFWMFVFMTIAVFAYAFIRRMNMRVSASTVWIYVALIGVCETVAYLAVTIGYSMTSLTSIVALISGGFALPTIVLAKLFLGEKPNKIQLVGGVVIIIGVMLLPLL